MGEMDKNKKEKKSSLIYRIKQVAKFYILPLFTQKWV
jgi:hypothetical protein